MRFDINDCKHAIDGDNINVADQHPDIVQNMKATYAKFAKDVGVVIPTTGNFANLFPAVTANNTQNINLTAQLVPGYWKAPQQRWVYPRCRLTNICKDER